MREEQHRIGNVAGRKAILHLIVLMGKYHGQQILQLLLAEAAALFRRGEDVLQLSDGVRDFGKVAGLAGHLAYLLLQIRERILHPGHAGIDLLRGAAHGR